MPAATVIMPMKNSELYVGLAIRSIQEQTFTDWELIVIDDGSTDRSRALVSSVLDPRIRIINGPRRGISAAFNRGLSVARGKYLFRCDSDDLLPPDRLAWQVDWLQKHPEFGAISGSFQTIDQAGKLISNLNCGDAALEITDELRTGESRSSLNSLAAYSQIYQTLGGLREYFVTAGDLDFLFRLANVCRVGYEPKLSYRYRLHNDSITHVQPNPMRIFYEETSRRFARQRFERGKDYLELGKPPEAPRSEAKPLDSREQIYGMLLGAASAQRTQGSRLAAARLAFRACRLRPADVTGWRVFLACSLGRKPRG